jgi:hypothetical protein
MKKTILESFIKKYSLNGTLESVKWVAKDKKLHVDTITEDKTVLIKVDLKAFEDFTDESIGVHETSRLKGMLAPFGDDIQLSVVKTKDKVTGLTLDQGKIVSSFPAADLDVIATAPSLKGLPDPNCEIILDSTLIESFIKAKSGLPEVDTFTLLSKKDKIYLVLGYSKLNTPRSTLEVASTGTIEKPISFSAKFFKEILTANSDCTASNLKVSDKGLAIAEFENDNFKCSYYMVTIKMDE